MSKCSVWKKWRHFLLLLRPLYNGCTTCWWPPLLYIACRPAKQNHCSAAIAQRNNKRTRENFNDRGQTTSRSKQKRREKQEGGGERGKEGRKKEDGTSPHCRVHQKWTLVGCRAFLSHLWWRDFPTPSLNYNSFLMDSWHSVDWCRWWKKRRKKRENKKQNKTNLQQHHELSAEFILA